VAALLSLFVLLGLWYALPLWLRWVAQGDSKRIAQGRT
jgi:hypothetical protein